MSEPLVLSTPIPMRYLEAVDRGLALIDERIPGSLDEVVIDILDLESCVACVLGQIFGEYGRGLDHLEVAMDYQPWRYGFTVNFDEELSLARDLGYQLELEGAVNGYISRRYAELTEAWKAKLRVRLGQ